ncbi:MAG: iron ABC transporter permease [Eubacteriales bacterium]|nr:iron ABC transporter permease [Eubacteriales bacterium]
MKKIKLDFWFWVKIGVGLILLVFLVYPFFTLISRSFFSTKEEGFTLYNYLRIFSKKHYYLPIIRSLFMAVVTVLTTTVIGVPMAYIMTRYKLPGKGLIHVAVIMSLMSPPFIGAYSWITLFGKSGFITKLLEGFGITMPTIYGWGGILSVFAFKLFPYIYLYTVGALGSIDSSLEEAAENLGSSKLRRLFTVTLPVVFPSITAGAIMVFMTCLADFGTPMLLGQGDKYRVLAVLIFDEYMSEMGGNANLASALSVIAVVISVCVLLVQQYLVARKNYVMSTMRPPKKEELKGWKKVMAMIFVCTVTFIGIIPQIVVVVSSFIKTDFAGFVGGFSLDSYITIANRLGTNIVNTFVYSGVAIVIIVLIGVLTSYIIVRQRGFVSKAMDLMIMFPYVIPGAVLGIGLIVAFNRPPLILTGTAAIMIISYVVRKLPYTVRSGSAFLEQMDKSVEEASINLGVSPMKTFFTVTARLMMPGVISGAILSWINCINELSSSIMLYGGETSTIAVAIYTETARNSYGTAAAMASILTVATTVSLLLFLRISKGNVSVV